MRIELPCERIPPVARDRTALRKEWQFLISASDQKAKARLVDVPRPVQGVAKILPDSRVKGIKRDCPLKRLERLFLKSLALQGGPERSEIGRLHLARESAASPFHGGVVIPVEQGHASHQMKQAGMVRV
ncbi:hypothetical protein [Bradyrhizobium sp. S3.3.6]|uniref:hypothetical protein n=1 Tax=Bradyrhizobium sp. S3.3.6 TaxID=3156429 RepID=UPI0033958B1D